MAIGGIDGAGAASAYSQSSNVNSRAGRTELTEEEKYLEAKDKASLDMEDFLQLLAAQLRYQDMSSPMSNAEMMQQMTQMASVSSMTNMSDMMSGLAQISTTTYAASMIGKELTVVDKLDAENKPVTVKGVVTGVGFYNGMPCVYVNGKSYSMGQIQSMGDVTEEPPKEDVDDDKEPSVDPPKEE